MEDADEGTESDVAKPSGGWVRATESAPPRMHGTMHGLSVSMRCVLGGTCMVHITLMITLLLWSFVLLRDPNRC